jgi:hypothetical protein
LEVILYNIAKEIEGNHIENQMNPVGMKKARQHHPMVLPPVDNLIRIHHPAILLLRVIPGIDANYAGDYD